MGASKREFIAMRQAQAVASTRRQRREWLDRKAAEAERGRAQLKTAQQGGSRPADGPF